MKYYIKLLFLLIFSFCSYGNEGSDQLFGNWTTVFLTGKFGKDSPFNYLGEAGIRSSQYPESFNKDNMSYDIGSVPIRAGIGYQFDTMNSFMIGYLYQYTQPPYAKTDVNENRAWQQLQNFLKFDQYGTLQNRFRFEQRTITTANDTALRARYQVKYTYPFNKDWGFVFNEEVFWNCNTVSWGPVGGFDQNRVFVGPVYNFNDVSKVEFGYLNSYTNKDLVSDLIGHILAINFYYNIK